MGWHPAPAVPQFPSGGGSAHHEAAILSVQERHPQVDAVAGLRGEPRRCRSLVTGTERGRGGRISATVTPHLPPAMATPPGRGGTEVGFGARGIGGSHAALVDVPLAVAVPRGPHQQPEAGGHEVTAEGDTVGSPPPPTQLGRGISGLDAKPCPPPRPGTAPRRFRRRPATVSVRLSVCPAVWLAGRPPFDGVPAAGAGTCPPLVLPTGSLFSSPPCQTVPQSHGGA